jgi:NAD(P)-dependent dehydrogenase (short-subunit alcohol dehydrogenase family)
VGAVREMTGDGPARLDSAGRTVMISGANRGIGLAIARRLHADGYSLSLGARDPVALARATADLGDASVLRHAYEARDTDSAAPWVAATVARFGRLDGLVNNAGILHHHTVEPFDEALLDESWAVNVKAPYRLSLAAMAHLRAVGCGRIVNLVSIAGIRYKGGSPSYAITKFAAMGLAQVLRRVAWDEGVRVTALCPGDTLTDMTALSATPAEIQTSPESLAGIVSQVLALPNTASVATITVNCHSEPAI